VSRAINVQPRYYQLLPQSLWNGYIHFIGMHCFERVLMFIIHCVAFVISQFTFPKAATNQTELSNIRLYNVSIRPSARVTLNEFDPKPKTAGHPLLYVVYKLELYR